MNIPAKFEAFLSPYCALQKDGASGEVITWGHRVNMRLPEELWEELKEFGTPTVIVHGIAPQWALVTKALTHAEAIEKYGPVTSEELGPQGGFRSITFGKTTFISRQLKRPKEAS